MFNIKAVGGITAAGKPNKAISARYADAPAGPTNVYKTALKNMQAANSSSNDVMANPLLSHRFAVLPRRAKTYL